MSQQLSRACRNGDDGGQRRAGSTAVAREATRGQGAATSTSAAHSTTRREHTSGNTRWRRTSSNSRRLSGSGGAWRVGTYTRTPSGDHRCRGDANAVRAAHKPVREGVPRHRVAAATSAGTPPLAPVHGGVGALPTDGGQVAAGAVAGCHGGRAPVGSWRDPPAPARCEGQRGGCVAVPVDRKKSGAIVAGDRVVQDGGAQIYINSQPMKCRREPMRYSVLTRSGDRGWGDHGEVVEWLELVCVCANVLCWLS